MTGRVLWAAMQAVRVREAMYGPPAEHWERTAELVTVLLRSKGLLAPGAELDAATWGEIMVLEKLSRRQGPDAGVDQLIDIAGYADGLGRLNGFDEPQADAEGSVA